MRSRQIRDLFEIFLRTRFFKAFENILKIVFENATIFKTKLSQEKDRNFWFRYQNSILRSDLKRS